MSKRYYFAAEIALPLDQAWAAFDYPAAGWALSGGGPREVGTLRECTFPEIGRFQDRLLAYQTTEHTRSLSYAIINEDNPLGVRGYEGSITILRNTADPSRSFFNYTSRWDEAEGPVVEMLDQMLPGMIQGALAASEAAA